MYRLSIDEEHRRDVEIRMRDLRNDCPELKCLTIHTMV